MWCAVHDTPFLASPRIAFNSDAKTFVDHESKIRYKGVTKLLAASFYPEYTYRDRKKPRRVRWRGKPGVTDQRSGSRKRNSGKKGLSRGRSVDRQLGVWVQRSKICCSLCARLQPKNIRSTIPGSSGVLGVPRPCKDPFALAVCAKLAEIRLVPVAAQVVVADRQRCIATAVDLVCRNADGEYVLIEIKSGFERTLHASTGNLLHAPFASINKSDCPLNQFHLQLLVTSVLFRLTFPDCTNVGWPQIMITNAAGCTVVPLAHWAVRTGARLLPFLG